MSSDIEKHDITKLDHQKPAPGRPGVDPSWSSGAKTAVGTAVALQSRVWFTITEGVLSEVYFPDIDRANLRGLRFLVAGDDFFSDEQHEAEHNVEFMSPGVPAFRIRSVCKKGQYRILKELIADPARAVLLISVAFEPAPHRENIRLYLIADPHVGDRGIPNNAWVGQYKSIPMLFAESGGLSLGIASSATFTGMSCGFIGKNDGLTDIRAHKRMTHFYTEASKGNVSLAAELDWRACKGRFQVALAFGGHPAEAGQQARAGLLQNFSSVRDEYVKGWEAAQANYMDLSSSAGPGVDQYRASVAVMRTHESKRFPGGFVASLSIPWGFDRGDAATGGYHVLWPRDMGETALGLLACGDAEGARRALFYLRCTQEKDGNWSQNMWLDGTPHWTSTQMDGTSFGILIADALRRAGQLRSNECWPMIKAAAGFLARNGPVTEEDRWEANAGYSPYTMAVEVAALLAAADFAEANSENWLAEFLRATADAWNDAIDELTYASGTKLAQKHGVDGYYFRIMPPEGIRATSPDRVMTELKNHVKAKREHRAVDIISPDALALVRFGVRSANDPKILNTVKLIDATLKTLTSTGPVWHRYTYDGYGEHKDGGPYHKTGEGRGWPLLAGERAHYEIACGNFEAAQRLRATIEAQTSECGMIPEQVWDAPDIPKRQLFNGHPTGSGMPLVWAHAEYVKLLRSIKEQKVWDTPPQTVQRYLVEKTTSPYQIWTERQQRAFLSPGKNLRVESPDGTGVRWSVDGGKTRYQLATTESGLGVRWAVLPVSECRPGTRVQFYFYSSPEEQGRAKRFEVKIR